MDYQLTKLIQRIQRLSANERQLVIDCLDNIERARQSRIRAASTSASRPSSEEQRLINLINYFDHLNKKTGPVTSDLTTAEGRAEYDYLLRIFDNGTISQLESELLWVLDYRFSRCSTKLAQKYREKMNIPVIKNGSRSMSNQAKQTYESTPRPGHR